MVCVAASLLLAGAAAAADPDYAADARALDRIIAANYAYLDRQPGGTLPVSAVLDARRDAVHDARSLLHYVEDRLASLADHHAIAGRSFGDSWALVPSYSDLWIETAADGGFVVTSVRDGSPAAAAGIAPGDRIEALGGIPTARAVAAFLANLGLEPTQDRRDYAVRVLAAGRRDRSRSITIGLNGAARTISLASLYATDSRRSPISVVRNGGGTSIRVNDSLGDDATVAAFDTAMAALPPGERLTLDLTDTPSGGNTNVARAMMGWFVDRPRYYQTHRLVAEERATGIVRQWTEQVLPRADKRWRGRLTVRVGRWTGSMGEGMAIGLDAIGARVEGTPMAGLLGAVYDFTLPESGIVVKLPAERLTTPAGLARERFVPAPIRNRRTM